MRDNKWRGGCPTCQGNFQSPNKPAGIPDFDEYQNPAPPIYVPGQFIYQNYFPKQKPWEQVQSEADYCGNLTNMWWQWDNAVGQMLSSHWICLPFAAEPVNPPPPTYPQLCQPQTLGVAPNHVFPCARFDIQSKNRAMSEATERLWWFLVNTTTNIHHIQDKINVLSRMECADSAQLFSASHGKTMRKYVYLRDDADSLGFVVLPIVWLCGHDCAGEAPELRNEVRDFDLRIELPKDEEDRLIVIAAAALYLWHVYMVYKHGQGHFIYTKCGYPEEVQVPLGCGCSLNATAVWTIPWVDGIGSLNAWYAHRWSRVRVADGQITFETWLNP